MKLKSKEKLVLLGSSFVYLVMHIVNIGRWNFWHDESFSAMTIEYNWGEMIERTARDVHPPLYYIFLKPWSDFFGDGEIALRSMSVMFSLISFLLAYLLIRRLFSVKAAMSAALFMMVAPFLIRYGVEARMYPMAATFILINAHAFISILRSQRQFLFIPIYILSITAALYTQYYSGLVLVGHGLYLLYLNGAFKSGWWREPGKLLQSTKKISLKWWLSWVSILLLFAPWIPKLIDQLVKIQGAFWIRDVSHESFYSTLTSLLFFNDSYEMVGYEAISGLLAVGAFLFLVISVFIREKPKRKQLYFISGAIFVPAVCLFVVSLVLQPTYFDRYFALFATMFYSLIGVALYYAYSKQYWKKPILVLITLLLVGSLAVGNKIVYYRGEFDGDKSVYQMESIMEYVDSNFSNGDRLLVDGLGSDFFDVKFYNTTNQVVQVYSPGGFSPWGNHTLVYDRPELLIEDLETDYNYGETVWFFSYFTSDNNQIPSDWIDTGIKTEQGRGQVTKYVVR